MIYDLFLLNWQKVYLLLFTLKFFVEVVSWNIFSATVIRFQALDWNNERLTKRKQNRAKYFFNSAANLEQLKFKLLAFI